MKSQKTIVQLTSFVAMFALVFSGFFPASFANKAEAQVGAISAAPVVTSAPTISVSENTKSESSSTESSNSSSVSKSETSVSNGGSSSSSSGGSSGSSSKTKTKTISAQLKNLDNLDQINPKVIKIIKDNSLASAETSVSETAEDNNFSCPEADFNEDQVIDTRDIIAFLNAWNEGKESTDMNSDGEFTQEDVDTFLRIWEDCFFGLGVMCYAPDNLGIINRTDLGSSSLQEILKDYTGGNDEEEIVRAYEDQINYQIWRMNVSGSLSGLNLSCDDADYDKNGVVDTRDMLAYLNDWTNQSVDADMNNDSIVDNFDFHVFFNLWKICDAGEDIELENSLMEVELIASKTNKPIVFGYYFNGDLESFTPVFKVGNHTDYPDVPEFSSSDVTSFTPKYFTDGEFVQEIGFAVDVQGFFDTTIGRFTNEKFATERSLNSDTSVQALTYDYDKDQFIIAFDDVKLLDGSDADFDDLIVKITAKTCEEGGLETPVLESPEDESFVKGDSLTSMWSKVSGAINYIYQRFSDEDGNEFVLQNDASDNQVTHENLDGQVFWWRVKANGSSGQSGWTELRKVTVDNSAPSTQGLSISNGQSFVGSIPFSGTTVDNWNVDKISISQSEFSGGECGAFSEIGVVDIVDNSADTNWDYTWNPGADGSFCLKAEGIDLAGNIEEGSQIQDIAFTSSDGGSGGNGGGDSGNGGGGSSGGGGYDDGGNSSGDGRVLGAFSGDDRDQLLNLLRLRLLALQGQLNNLEQPVADEGEVLGIETAEAQEVPEEEVMEEDNQENIVVESPEEGEGMSKTILWILFIIILLIILFLIFKRRKEEDQQ